jgi:hypothetical protein
MTKLDKMMDEIVDHMDMDEHITSEQAAIYLASIGLTIPAKTLINYRANGRGPAYWKLGSTVTYTRADLKAWRTTARVRIDPSQATLTGVDPNQPGLPLGAEGAAG